MEIRLTPYSTLRHDHIRVIVETFLRQSYVRLPVDGVEIDSWRTIPILEANCESIKATDCSAFYVASSLRLRLRGRMLMQEGYAPAHESPHPLLKEVVLLLHVYQASASHTPEDLFATAGGEDDGEDGSPITAASVRELPSKELEGVWDTYVPLSLWSQRMKCLLKQKTAPVGFPQVDLRRRHQKSPAQLHSLHSHLLGRRHRL